MSFKVLHKLFYVCILVPFFRFQNFLIFIFRFSFSILENGTVVPKARMIILINVLKHKFYVLFVVFIFFTKNHDIQKTLRLRVHM